MTGTIMIIVEAVTVVPDRAAMIEMISRARHESEVVRDRVTVTEIVDAENQAEAVDTISVRLGEGQKTATLQVAVQVVGEHPVAKNEERGNEADRPILDRGRAQIAAGVAATVEAGLPVLAKSLESNLRVLVDEGDFENLYFRKTAVWNLRLYRNGKECCFHEDFRECCSFKTNESISLYKCSMVLY